MEKDLRQLTEKGLSALDHQHYYLAQVCFEQAATIERTPVVCSCLAFCLAANRHDIGEAISLCNDSISRDSTNSLHYYNLGRIYVISGEKGKAIDAFRQGLRLASDPRIVKELDRLGTRRPPVIRSLPRNHFLNKYLGIILSRLGLR